MAKERDLSIDLLKAIAIYFVIYGHCIQYFGAGIGVLDDPVGKLIYMVHMPLFMFVSGYVSKVDGSWGGVVQRLKNLIIPMITWCIIFYAVDRFLSFDFSNLNLTAVVKGLCSNFIYDYWFIWALIMCYLYSAIATTLGINKKSICLIYFAIFFLIPDNFLHIRYFLHFKVLFPFYFLGMCCHEYNILYRWGLRLKDRNWNKHYILSIIIVCALLYFLLWKIGNGSLFLYNLNLTFFHQTSIEITHNLLGMCFIVVSAIIGITLLMIICDLITLYCKVPKTIIHIGQHTLSIYFLQGVFFNSFLNHYDISINNQYLVFVVGFFLLFMFYWFTIPLSCFRVTRYVFLGKK